jgi:6,7-dimethyl-8-ribityllumazine synthase
VKQYWEAYKYRDDKPAAFIALGCVIQGDTPHFDHVCNIVTQGTLQLNLSLPTPTIFGILTVLNETQAWERLGGKHGHKGEEAALTAMSMIVLAQSFRNRT